MWLQIPRNTDQTSVAPMSSLLCLTLGLRPCTALFLDWLRFDFSFLLLLLCFFGLLLILASLALGPFGLLRLLGGRDDLLERPRVIIPRESQFHVGLSLYACITLRHWSQVHDTSGLNVPSKVSSSADLKLDRRRGEGDAKSWCWTRRGSLAPSFASSILAVNLRRQTAQQVSTITKIGNRLLL